jgi:anti-sigma factor ChrR (cupin superfamily)
MNPQARTHDQEHAELVVLYALHSLPASEVPAAEAHIATCPDCRNEMEALRPLIGAFISWPTDLLRPSPSLWSRLAERIAAETGEPVVPEPPGRVAAEWQEAAPGISCALLATDTAQHRVSMLVRLAPGTDYPAHRHAGVEELHLLDGELMIDDKKLYPGDYIRSEPGTVDHRVWSETGCTCVLLTSFQDEIL